MKFVPDTSGGLVNLDHVAHLERCPDIKTGFGSTLVHYRACGVGKELLGYVSSVDVEDLEDAPDAVVPDHGTGTVVVVVSFKADGGYQLERFPVLAWKVYYDRNRDHMPVAAYDPPGKGSPPEERWFVELAEAYAPRRWIFPDDASVTSFDHAIAHAREQWQRAVKPALWAVD